MEYDAGADATIKPTKRRFEDSTVGVTNGGGDHPAKRAKLEQDNGETKEEEIEEVEEVEEQKTKKKKKKHQEE
jgi:hypothetical protein